MSGFWAKAIVQTGYITFIFFFAALFLAISGTGLFLAQVFTAKGFAIIFFFMLFNVFFTLNWK